MKTLIAIQTNTKPGFFVTEDKRWPLVGMYRYCRTVEDAILFPNVTTAVKWIERNAFYSNLTYSGTVRLVRVEVDMEPTYKVMGLVE